MIQRLVGAIEIRKRTFTGSLRKDTLRPWSELDHRIRRRLGLILWPQWKRPRARRGELRKRRLGKDRAGESAYKGHGPWWSAGSGRGRTDQTPEPDGTLQPPDTGGQRLFCLFGLLQLLSGCLADTHAAMMPIAWSHGPPIPNPRETRISHQTVLASAR
jgi:hypothetical protein